MSKKITLMALMSMAISLGAGATGTWGWIPVSVFPDVSSTGHDRCGDLWGLFGIRIRRKHTSVGEKK